MKSLKLNFLMPSMAVVFALTSAFASQTEVENTDEDPRTGYIHRNEPCEPVIVDCNLEGDDPCTFMGLEVFEKGSLTTCQVPLYFPEN